MILGGLGRCVLGFWFPSISSSCWWHMVPTAGGSRAFDACKPTRLQPTGLPTQTLKHLKNGIFYPVDLILFENEICAYLPIMGVEHGGSLVGTGSRSQACCKSPPGRSRPDRNCMQVSSIGKATRGLDLRQVYLRCDRMVDFWTRMAKVAYEDVVDGE